MTRSSQEHQEEKAEGRKNCCNICIFLTKLILKAFRGIGVIDVMQSYQQRLRAAVSSPGKTECEEVGWLFINLHG
jgi:hypothetical protein